MLLHHYYEQDSECQSNESKAFIPLKSIKQIFNEDSSYAEESFYHTGAHLPLKIKGMVLNTILHKNFSQNKNQISKFLLRWYAKKDANKQQEAINKFLTYGRIRKQKVFYMFKIMAKKEINKPHTIEKSQKSSKSKINQVRAKKIQERISRVSQRYSIQMPNPNLIEAIANKKQNDFKCKKRKTQSNHEYIIRKYQEQRLKKEKEMKDNTKSEKKHCRTHTFESSINKILLQSDQMISDEQTENNDQNLSDKSIVSGMQKIAHDHKLDQINQNQEQPKKSISQIDLINAEVPIELMTCTNIFQSAPKQEKNRHSLILAASLDFIKVFTKINLKFLHKGFRKLLENTMQENYEQQLLKAKRNLELVQLNFMAECEMQSLANTYEQQSQHLQKIDKNLEILKQKFALSRTSSILRVLKKLVYPILKITFQDMVQNLGMVLEQNENSASIYQVQQLIAVSSTSLSQDARSSRILNFFERGGKISIIANANAGGFCEELGKLKQNFSKSRDQLSQDSQY